MNAQVPKGSILVPRWIVGVLIAMLTTGAGGAVAWSHYVTTTIAAHDQHLQDLDGRLTGVNDRLDRINTKLDRIIDHMLRDD